jgi:tetratricopeptide (TPR) repeat protein
LWNSGSNRDFERGVEALERGDADLGIACFDAVIRLHPESAPAHLWRGLAYHRRQDLDKAIENYTTAIRLEPNDAPGYARRGLAYDAKRQTGMAISDYTKAININPNYAQTYVLRAVSFLKRRDTEAAIEDCNTAIRLNLNDPSAYTTRGAAYADQRAYDMAFQDYTTALRLTSDYLPANQKFAWLLATCPRAHLRSGKRAQECVLEAKRKMHREDARILETQAAVCAETGQFEEAVRLQRKALAKRQYSREEVAEARMRLKLYKRKKPYRERDRA